jgi:hypothetical protein
MQLTMRGFNFLDYSRQIGIGSFQLIAAFTLKPLAEVTFVVIGLDIDLTHIRFCPQAIDLIDPIKVIHLLLGQQAVQMISPAIQLNNVRSSRLRKPVFTCI